MTALGFVLIIFSLWLGSRFGHQYPPRKNAWDYLAGVLFNLGSFCLLVGIVLWLWQGMP